MTFPSQGLVFHDKSVPEKQTGLSFRLLPWSGWAPNAILIDLDDLND